MDKGGRNYGVVVMEAKGVHIQHGYYYDTATLYVYCDNCGSFSIKSYISARQWLLIIAVCGFMTVGTLATLTSSQPSGVNWGVVFVGLAICILAFKFLWGDGNYKCRKCENTPSTNCNTLDYPSDMRILDVPNQLTQTLTWGYWPDLFDIDGVLKRPEENNSLTPTEAFEVWECDECGATVAPAATVCPFCGDQFED
jgi:hypothetical protein